MRLDPNVKPTMYRCATVTRYEAEQLRRIENVAVLPCRAHERDKICLRTATAFEASTLFVDARQTVAETARGADVCGGTDHVADGVNLSRHSAPHLLRT